jgi:RNA polymerase sigma factor (sigma-70 family)
VRATYDPNRPFMPWLLAIVRNRLADGARRYARRAAHEVPAGDPDVTFEAMAANTDQDAFEDTEALALAIRALPRGQRRAIELLKLEELSLEEAAAATGSSIGALKVATHRALRTLRRTLNSTINHEN